MKYLESGPLRYRLEYSMPDGTTTKSLPPEAVVHVKINETREQPWQGRSPFDGMELLSAVEWGLLDLASLRNKRVIAAPKPQTNPDATQPDQARLSDMMAEVFGRAGTEVLYQQTARGNADTLKSTDLKYAPDQNAVELRRDLVSQAYECVGIRPHCAAILSPAWRTKPHFPSGWTVTSSP